MSEGMEAVSASRLDDCGDNEGEVTRAGIFESIEVLGLMSWWGDGSRLRLTDCRAEAISLAGLCAMIAKREER